MFLLACVILFRGGAASLGVGLPPGGESASRGYIQGGCLQGYLHLGGIGQTPHPPESEKRVVNILRECFLVCFVFLLLTMVVAGR